MKRFLAILLLVSTLLLTGCEFTSSTKLMCVSKSTTTSFSMSYAKFSGTEKHTLRTKSDAPVVMATIESESGTLKVTILDENKAVVYEQDALETGVYTITLPGRGKYTVRMDAQDHVGSYHFEWAE